MSHYAYHLKIDLIKRFLDESEIVTTFTGVLFADGPAKLPKAICDRYVGIASDCDAFAVACKDMNQKHMAEAMAHVELSEEYRLVDSFSPSEDPRSVMNVYLKRGELIQQMI